VRLVGAPTLMPARRADSAARFYREHCARGAGKGADVVIGCCRLQRRGGWMAALSVGTEFITASGWERGKSLALWPSRTRS